MESEKIQIDTAFITLGQLLKLLNIFESGGMIKHFLQEEGVHVNGQLENRRGKKLYPGDWIDIHGRRLVLSRAEDQEV